MRTHGQEAFGALLVVGLAAALTACAIGTAGTRVPTVGVENLIGGEWVAEPAGASGGLDVGHATLRFAAADRVAGDTACNRFGGPLATSGGVVRIGPLATTRRACEPAVMEQEQRYLQALARTRSLRLDGPVLVLVDDAQQALVRMTRAEPPATPTPSGRT